MSLPKYQTAIKELSLLQQTWSAELDPVVNNTFSNGQVLQSVSLVSGANTINHKLGRKLQGWVLTRLRASATIYDTQDANTMPEFTLLLNSSANAVVDIYVF